MLRRAVELYETLGYFGFLWLRKGVQQKEGLRGGINGLSRMLNLLSPTVQYAISLHHQERETTQGLKGMKRTNVEVSESGNGKVYCKVVTCQTRESELVSGL